LEIGYETKWRLQLAGRWQSDERMSLRTVMEVPTRV
jgi:hypothetical protein